MKKILSLLLIVTMSFSWTSVAASAGHELPKLTNVTSADNLNNMGWQEKKLLDLTASEVLNFLSLANKGSGANSSSGILAWLGSSFFSSVFPYISLYAAVVGLQKAKTWYNNFIARKNCGYIDILNEPTKAMELFDVLLSAVKGQNKAKEQMRKIVLTSIEKKKRMNNIDNNCAVENGATVIYMVGPSGIGKSYSAEIVTKVLTGMNSKPYIVEASDIDKQSSSSPVDQLFGMRSKKVSNSEVYECSPLVTQIKSTPDMVVLINEYDKMHSPELDEKLRTIMDHGYINVNGEKIDCSKTIFIITSNESSTSVKAGNQNIDFNSIDDGTGSRTFIKHDKAFLNRLKLVEFENLDKKSYEEIANIPFKALVDRYKLEYLIDLNLNDTLEQVSEKAEELNKGARPIYDFVDSLNDKILSDIILKGLCGEQYKNKKYEVSYNKINDNFELKEIIN